HLSLGGAGTSPLNYRHTAELAEFPIEVFELRVTFVPFDSLGPSRYFQQRKACAEGGVGDASAVWRGGEAELRHLLHPLLKVHRWLRADQLDANAEECVGGKESHRRAMLVINR